MFLADISQTKKTVNYLKSLDVSSTEHGLSQ